MAILPDLQVSARNFTIQQNSTQLILFGVVTTGGAVINPAGKKVRLVVRSINSRDQNDNPARLFTEVEAPVSANNFNLSVTLALANELHPGQYVYHAYYSEDNFVADSRLIGAGTWTVASSLMTL